MNIHFSSRPFNPIIMLTIDYVYLAFLFTVFYRVFFFLLKSIVQYSWGTNTNLIRSRGEKQSSVYLICELSLFRTLYLPVMFALIFTLLLQFLFTSSNACGDYTKVLLGPGAKNKDIFLFTVKTEQKCRPGQGCFGLIVDDTG